MRLPELAPSGRTSSPDKSSAKLDAKISRPHPSVSVLRFRDSTLRSDKTDAASVDQTGAAKLGFNRDTEI